METPANNRKTTQPLLRLGHPLAFASFLRHIGAPVERHFAHNKLPVLCDDPDAFVLLQRAWSFFATAVQHEDAMLGWWVGAHVGDHNLNAGLLAKLETSPTLYQALQNLVQMTSAEASHLQLGIQERADDVLLYTHYRGMRHVPGYASSQAYQIGVLLDLIRHFLGRQWLPKEIGIEHSITPAVAQQLFPGSRILIHQPMGYIVIPRRCLHQAVHKPGRNNTITADPLLSDNFDYIDTLRELLRAYLADGYPTAPFAAELMGVSERTLARRLSDCGLTYGALIDDVRFTEAKKLLQHPDARMADVAVAVGFHDQSHFTRMFRRIGGLSPTAFRNQVRRA